MSACWSVASFPKRDGRKLIELGVRRVFGPGTVLEKIAQSIRGQETLEAMSNSSRAVKGDRRALS